MTAAPKAAGRARAPETVSDAPSLVALITRDQLLGSTRPQVTREVVLPGWATFLVGELRQDALDEIDHLAKVRLLGADGKEKEAHDYRLWKPRLIAAALLNPDGTPMFPDWKDKAPEVAKLFTPAQANLLFEAVTEVNALTREAREALGKASPSTPPESGS